MKRRTTTRTIKIPSANKEKSQRMWWILSCCNRSPVFILNENVRLDLFLDADPAYSDRRCVQRSSLNVNPVHKDVLQHTGLTFFTTGSRDISRNAFKRRSHYSFSKSDHLSLDYAFLGVNLLSREGYTAGALCSWDLWASLNVQWVIIPGQLLLFSCKPRIYDIHWTLVWLTAGTQFFL